MIVGCMQIIDYDCMRLDLLLYENFEMQHPNKKCNEPVRTNLSKITTIIDHFWTSHIDRIQRIMTRLIH